LASASPTVAGSKPKKLLDQTRDVLRLKHYSLRTERSYCDWIERCDDLRRPAVWSSKSARPAKDFESCETVSIAENAQCPLVRCAAQPSLACHAIAFGGGGSRRKSNEGGSSLASHADSSRRSRTKTETTRQCHRTF